METDLVKVTEDMLKANILKEGHIALYEITTGIFTNLFTLTVPVFCALNAKWENAWSA